MNDEGMPEEEIKDLPFRKIYVALERQAREKRKKCYFKQWLIGVAVASLGIGVGIGGSISFFLPYGEACYRASHQENFKMGRQNLGQQDAKIEEADNGILPPELDGSIVSIVKSVNPSIVSIYNHKRIDTLSIHYMDEQEESKIGLGSGVIFDEDRDHYYIITNSHVIQEAETLVVCFINGHKIEAQIVGENSANDLAVICVDKRQLSQQTIKEIRIATLGDSDRVEVGQLAIAIGTPSTQALSNTVTTGVISGLERKIMISSNQMEVIQSSAAINSGNSGGALVGPTGEVIGINVAKTVDTEGIGFAIPINQVKDVIAEMMWPKS